MDNIFGMGVVMEVVDNASARLDAIGASFDATKARAEQFVLSANGLNGALSGLAGMSASLTGVGLGFNAVGSSALNQLSTYQQASKSYEKELATLKFTTQATGKEWEALTKKAQQAGIETQFSPEEAVQGLYELKSAGKSTKESIEALDAVMDFATMSNGAVNLSTSASLLASTMNKFSLSASQAYHIADVFSTATQESAFHAEDLSAFVNSIGAMPSTLGVPLEDTMAMGSMLMNIGQGAAQAGSTVQGFGRQIKLLTSQIQGGKVSKKKMSAMEALGIDLSTFWNEKGELRSMVDIFDDIVSGASNLNAKDKSSAIQALFATQAGNLETAIEQAQNSFMVYDEATQKYVVDPNSEARKSLKDLITKYQESDGVTKKGAEMMRGTAEGVQQLAEGAYQTLLIKLGNVTPAIEKFGNTLKLKVSTALVELLDKFPFLGRFVTTIQLVGGVLLKVVGAGALAVAGIMGLVAGFGFMATNLEMMKAGLIMLKGFMLGIPSMMGSATSAIGGLLLKMLPLALAVGAIALAWKTDFAGIRTTLTGFVSNVKNSFDTARQMSALGIDSFLENTRRLEESGNWWDWLSLKIMDFMLFFQGVAEVWSGSTLSDEMFTKLEERGLLPLIERLLDLKAICANVLEGIKAGFQDFSEKAKAFLAPLVDVIGNVVQAVAKFLAIDLSGIGNELTNVFGGNGINAEFWQNVGHWIGEASGWVLAFVLVWKVVIPVIGMVIGAIQGVVGAVQAVVTFFMSTFGAIVMVIAGVTMAVTSFIDMFNNGFSAVKEAIMLVGIALATIGAIILGVAGLPALIVGAIVAVVATLVIVIKDHWEQIMAFLAGIPDWISANIIEPVINFFSGLGEGIAEVWNGIVETVIGIVGGLFEGIATVVTGALDAVWQWVQSIWTAIGDFIRGILEGIQGAVQSAWEGITSAVATALDAIWNVVSMIWSGISSFIGDVLNALLGVIQSVWNMICEAVSSAMNAISGIVTSVWSAISGFISGIVNAILGVVTSTWSGMSSVISSVMTTIQSIVISIWENIKSGISSAVSGISDTIRNGFSSAISYVRGLASQAFNWGADIGNGLASGVRSKISSVTDSISGMANNIRAYLHFSEPDIGPLSDFHTWMPDFMGGMAEDIKGSKGKIVGAVNDVAKDLSGIAPAVQGSVDYAGVDAVSQQSQVTQEIQPMATPTATQNMAQGGEGVIDNSPSQALLAKVDSLIETVKTMGVGGSTGSKSQITFEPGSIVAQVDGKNTSDLEDLVNKITEIIRRRQEIEALASHT